MVLIGSVTFWKITDPNNFGFKVNDFKQSLIIIVHKQNQSPLKSPDSHNHVVSI